MGDKFLAVVLLGSSPTSRQQVVSLSQSSCVSPVEIADWRCGGGDKKHHGKEAWSSANHLILSALPSVLYTMLNCSFYTLLILITVCKSSMVSYFMILSDRLYFIYTQHKHGSVGAGEGWGSPNFGRVEKKLRHSIYSVVLGAGIAMWT